MGKLKGNPLLPRQVRVREPWKRFWERVNRDMRSRDGCWEWTGKMSGSTPIYYYERRPYNARRFAWYLHTKRHLAPEKQIKMLCWNMKCVRPTHFLIR